MHERGRKGRRERKREGRKEKGKKEGSDREVGRREQRTMGSGSLSNTAQRICPSIRWISKSHL